MAATTYKAKLTYPQVFLWRMSLFLVLAILLAIILDGQTQQLRTSFMANPGLNGLIIGVLIVGVVYSFRQVLRLYPEIRWVNGFRISDPGLTVDTTPVLLAPMATMLRDRTGHLSLATGAMRSLLDSVAARLDEQRETTRYLVGLLVFLGLLGTFWGLLQTVSSVGSTISALDTNGSENVMLFDQLKEGLAGPLKASSVKKAKPAAFKNFIFPAPSQCGGRAAPRSGPRPRRWPEPKPRSKTIAAGRRGKGPARACL